MTPVSRRFLGIVYSAIALSMSACLSDPSVGEYNTRREFYATGRKVDVMRQKNFASQQNFVAFATRAGADKRSSIATSLSPQKLKKGEIAPWDGWLLSDETIVDIIVELESCKERIIIAENKVRAEEKANCDRERAIVIAKLEACEKKRETQVNERDKELREMREELAKGESFWSHPAIVVGGVAVGFAGGALAAAVLAK